MICARSRTLRIFQLGVLGLAIISLGRPCSAAPASTRPSTQTAADPQAEALGIANDLLSNPAGKQFNWESAAYARLRALGPKAAGIVPILAARANDPNATIRAHVLGALAAVRLPATIPTLIAALDDPAKNLASIAMGGLVDLGPPAIPALENSLNGPDSKAWRPALTALSDIDPEGYAALLRAAASHRDLSIRGEASRRAGEMIPALIEPLHGKDSSARNAAAQSLTQKGPGSIRSILGLLNDPDSFTRHAAADAIGYQLGSAAGHPASRAALAGNVGLIARALSNPDPVVGNTLGEGLSKFPEGRDALAAAAADNDPRARAAATRWLGSKEPIRGNGSNNASAAADVAALLKALSDPDAKVRVAAAEALGQAHEKSAIDPLTVALLDMDPEVRLAAGRALLGMGAAAADGLDSGLRNTDPAIRLQSAQILGDLGPGVAAAVAPLLSDSNGDVRRAAVKALDLALMRGGSPTPLTREQRQALSLQRGALKELLRDADPATQTGAAMLLQLGGLAEGEDLARLLRTNDPQQRHVALQGLSKMPPEQSGIAAADLADVIRADPANRLVAAQVLSHIGQSASAQIFSLLTSPDRGVSSTMQSMLAGHTTSVELLGKMLRDPRQPVRAALLELMHGFNVREEVVLLAALKDADPVFRAAATGALGGDRSTPARAGLREMAKDADPRVRAAAAAVFDPRTEKDLLASLSRDPFPAVRAAAITRLAVTLEPDPASLIPIFLGAAQDGDETVRAAGADGLAKIYSRVRHDPRKPKMPPEMQTALENAIRDKSKSVRVAALKYFGQDPGGAEPFLATLLAILKDAGDPQRPPVLPVIAVLARDHPPALTALLAALSDHDEAMREAAASAFVTLNHAELAVGPANRNEAQKHLAELAAAASDGSARVRLAAALALVAIQPNYPAAAPALLAAFKDKDPAVRLAAADSLWRISPQTPGMRPALLAALDDPDPRMLQSLVQSLEMMPHAPTQPAGAGEGVPLGLISPDVATRRATAESLGQAGAAAINSAGRLLETATSDKDPEVRRAAATALKKILTAAVQANAAP